MIKYVDDDLFNAPSNSILLHACNCMGVWGSGVAYQFRQKFRTEHLLYEAYCQHTGPLGIGTCLLLNNVGCLFTSISYGKDVDRPELILVNTRSAITSLLSKTPAREFHLPKINSGLFKVPWEETEKILLDFPEITWYVYTGVKK